jgi:hypothetical protein
MFEDDYLLDARPAMTRRQRRDRKDAERKASEAEFMRGFHAAEVDHEDGATLRGILERAESLIPETPVGERPYLVGRVAYCREALRDRLR